MKLGNASVLSICLCLLGLVNGDRLLARSHHSRSRAPYPVRVDENGVLHAIRTHKTSLMKTVGLQLRDLRHLNLSYPSYQLFSRPDAVILALEQVKVVVNYNKAVVFSDGGGNPSDFLLALQHHIQAIRSTQSSKTFEHEVIDFALETTRESFSLEAHALQSTVHQLHAKQSKDSIQVLKKREWKQQLLALQQRVKEVQRVIKEVLDDDAALQGMQLNKNHSVRKAERSKPLVLDAELLVPHADQVASGISDQSEGVDESTNSTIELELMLEEHLHQLGLLSLTLSSLQTQVETADAELALQQELTYQRRLRFELALSMGSFVVSCAALVTGLFGMNLLSHVEHQPIMFWAVTFSLGVGMWVAYGKLSTYGKSEKLF